MIDVRSIQWALVARGQDIGKVDGVFGPKTKEAMRRIVAAGTTYPDTATWQLSRVRVAFEQMMMKEVGIDVGKIDGLLGPQTQYAYERWQDHLRETTAPEPQVSHQPVTWPRQRDAASFFGGIGQNLVSLELPYPMQLCWNPKTTVRRFQIHRRVAKSAERVYTKVLSHYGEQQVKALGLNLFGGCYNPRRVRGGSGWSMHAYGAAIDHDTENNQFRWDHTKARFARHQYDPWWRFWEEEGWISLGRERDYDWQHVQAVRL